MWNVSANSRAWIQNCGMSQLLRSLGFSTVGMSQLIRSLGSRIVGMSQLIRSLAFRIVRMSQLVRSLGFRLVRMSQWSRTVGEQPCTLQDHICSHVRNNQPSPKSDVKVDCLDQTHDNCYTHVCTIPLEQALATIEFVLGWQLTVSTLKLGVQGGN